MCPCVMDGRWCALKEFEACYCCESTESLSSMADVSCIVSSRLYLLHLFVRSSVADYQQRYSLGRILPFTSSIATALAMRATCSFFLRPQPL